MEKIKLAPESLEVEINYKIPQPVAFQHDVLSELLGIRLRTQRFDARSIRLQAADITVLKSSIGQFGNLQADLLGFVGLLQPPVPKTQRRGPIGLEHDVSLSPQAFSLLQDPGNHNSAFPTAIEATRT